MGDIKTIIYLTDNSLDEKVYITCRDWLYRAAGEHKIVSVSQKPIDIGTNVCVGEIGRSGLSIDLQMKAGLEKVDTKYVAIAEHDCLYTREHFDWEPTDDNYFWYNDNCWLVQYNNPKYPEWNGMYSHIGKRRVQSQLICTADKLREITEKKIAILSDSNWMELYPTGRIGEPGTNHLSRTRELLKREKVRHLWPQVKDYITKYGAKDFKTKLPNLDIRHGLNFTGPRRGKKRTFNLPYWGEFKEIIYENSKTN